MPHSTFCKAIVALSALAGVPAFAASYYIVAPVPGKKVANSAILVSLSAVTEPTARVGVPFQGLDLQSALSVTGDPGYTGYGVSWDVVAGNLPAGLGLAADGSVKGTPSVAGTSVFTVRATYMTKSGQQQYQLRVDAGTSAGEIRPDSESYFGTVTLGAYAVKTFTFQNTGDTAMTGLSVGTTGANGFAVQESTCGNPSSKVSLAKGASCSVTVRYQPLAAGFGSDALTARWDGPGAAQDVEDLSGNSSVDYSAQMAGFTAPPIAIGRHSAWAEGLQWYWKTANAQVSAPVGIVEFRRTVVISGSVPVTAHLYGGADDTITHLAVNGSSIFSNTPMHHSAYSSSPGFTLQPGINVLAVQVGNATATANPAGMALLVRQADGSRLTDENGWRIQP